ncbi:MAG TPA: hypothetical protein VK944_08855 [Candidatus Limnocylindria bacterium]|nr:hypothetical protein [Deltaproteobacteria bacterium]HSM00218.1 hypothetical protein [Candidatus Limnocylindria bacterium]
MVEKTPNSSGAFGRRDARVAISKFVIVQIRQEQLWWESNSFSAVISKISDSKDNAQTDLASPCPGRNVKK